MNASRMNRRRRIDETDLLQLPRARRFSCGEGIARYIVDLNFKSFILSGVVGLFFFRLQVCGGIRRFYRSVGMREQFVES